MQPVRGRSFLWFTLVAIALATALKAPTWGLTHKEPDEVIYWTLAHSLLERGEYGLQGTRLLEILPAEMYDRPLFHHPPLYPLALVPFAAADAWSAAIVVSWLGHALAIVAVGLVVARPCRSRGVPATSFAFWLPLLAIALDPIFLFTSRKLWIDALLGGLTFLAVACALAARDGPHERRWLVGAGVTLGLACLAKLTAVLALPAIVAAILWPRRDGPGRTGRTARTRSTPRGLALGLVGAPALLLTAPWFAVFWAEYGTLLPWWSRPSAEMITRDPLIRAAVSQGPLYYLARLACVQPLFAVATLLAVCSAARRRTAARVALVLAATFVLGLTLIAQAGGSPHFLRYLIPMFPCAAVLLGAVLVEGSARLRSWALFAATACIAYSAASSVPYLLTSKGNELFSLLEDWAGWYR